MKHVLIGMMLLAASLPVTAQEQAAALDRIEVTGSRISYRDLLETPAIAITKPGDYLLQEFRLESDTRDKAGRTRELHETIAKLISAAGSRYGVLFGDAYRVTLDRGNYRVALEENTKRADTSGVTLQLRADLGADPKQADAIGAAMQKFLREAATVGRTEVQVVGETALGMGKPERYRYDLITAISQDTTQVMQSLGLQCTVELGGLNSRIEWQRVSAGELLLYIPYTMTINGCVGRKQS
ncbi:hypothetical protein [Lysobacter terrae]